MTTTMGLIGDSTVASTYGWGPAFAADVPDGVKVLNYARNGATLDSLSGQLDELLKLKPDYVFIQFGHNDMKRYDTGIYGDKLRDYVTRVRMSGATPIVFSSVTRRNFDGDGKIAPAVINGRTLADYAQAARSIAREMKVHFIDLHAISIEHHNKIGPEESATYNFQPDDKTHFSPKGAREIAALIVEELKNRVPAIVCLQS